ncbi:hypothetical protein ES705_12809 [subsurface metagenome]
MAGKFNYELLPKYPHLLGEDKEVWTRFVVKFPNRFDTVDYDVHVGTGIIPAGEVDIKTTEQWKDLTRKRIDVLGWKGKFAQIIEVKKRVGLPALGQVLGYRFLYQREYPDVFLKQPLILCSRIDKDDSDVLVNFGVLFEVV